jgi:carboxymethylenebutenolidase
MKTLLLAALLLLPRLALAQAHVHGGADASSPVPAHEKHPVDAKVDAPTGKMVELSVAEGPKSKAYLAEPKGASRGAVLVVHEWWGLNDHIKHEADLLARAGYLALAVDLYEGTVATTPEAAGKAMQAVDAARALAVEKAGITFLLKSAPGKKLATIGWCFGGGHSLEASLAAAELGTPVAGTVIYYGLPIDDVSKLKTLKGAVLGIWAKQDGWITPEKVAAFDTALTQAGVAHTFHSYDADHAFANPTGGKYNPPAARDADAVRAAFLAQVLK